MAVNIVVKMLQITTIARMLGSRELKLVCLGSGLGGVVLPALVAIIIIVGSTH